MGRRASPCRSPLTRLPTESRNALITLSPLLPKPSVMARLSRVQIHRFRREPRPSEPVSVVPIAAYEHHSYSSLPP
ncbi:hypothetical protein IG631_06858 [Alternaria alternata]|nr:hypothetical protein IG631_06858 [Alternaria alternata]